jgi:putative ABC transport system permease protein
MKMQGVEMKTIIRNFLSVLRRFKMATVLNILGLSVAFAAFIILMMQVSYDWGYDRFHENTNRLFRLELTFDDGSAQAVLPRPLIDEFIASSSHIESGALIKKWDNRRNLVIQNNQGRVSYQELYQQVYPAYPEVFSFDMLEGKLLTLEAPDKVIIPERVAKKLFPKESAIGKYFVGDELKAEIGGVYRDFPENSVVGNAVYQKISDKDGADSWNYNNYEAYILVDHPENVSDILLNYKTHYRMNAGFWDKKDLRLTHVPDIYYLSDIVFDSQTSKGNQAQILILLFIAIIIVVIAAINFINFSNALTPVRMKSINTQKVLGCPVRTLRLSMLFEAVLICFIAFCLSVGLVAFLSGTSFSDTVSGGIRLSAYLPLIAGTGIFAVLTGVIAGIGPSLYITSFQPALVLKGNFGLSSRGKRVRTFLVGIQFVTSFILIVGSVFINIQNRFMTHSSLGFDKDQIAVVKLNSKLAAHTGLLRKELNNIPEIEETATADRIIGGGDTYSNYGRTYQGEQIFYKLIHADPSIVDVLGISIKEGRGFFPEDMKGEGALIFNETARKEYGIETGSVIELDWEQYHFREKVVGIMDDVKYNSYRSELEPFAFYTKEGFRAYALIRIKAGANYQILVESVRKTLLKIDPDYPLEINLYNEILNNVYIKELVLGRQITLFSLIAIFISLVGVFGVVLFESEYKKREIAIRKVFGSTIREILLLLNNQYLRILLVCFLLAIPISWYVMNLWLKNFSYKTPMYWWIFALAFLSVTLITLLTVTVQNWRAASANPVDSIKAE